MKKRDSKRKHELTVIYHAPRWKTLFLKLLYKFRIFNFNWIFMGMEKLSTPLEYNIPLIIIYKTPF